MEINITRFVTECDPFNFSASQAERGDNVGPETWSNAKPYIFLVLFHPGTVQVHVS